MRYLIKKSIKYIKYNLKSYLLIFFQLLLCFSIIYTGTNQSVAYENQKKIITNNLLHSSVMITPYLKNEDNNFTTMVMDIKEIETLYEKYNNIFKIYFGYSGYIPIIDANNKIINLSYLSINNNLFNEIYNTPRERSTIFGSENIINLLKKSKIINRFEIGETNIENSTKIKTVHNVDSNLALSFHNNLIFDLDETLILPILEYEDYLNNQETLSIPIISLKILNDSSHKYIEEFYRDLEELYPQYIFGNSNVYDQFIKGTEDLSELLRVLTWASKVTLLIVFFGIIGLLFSFIVKREKSIVISRIMGASRKEISLEIGLEVMIITFISSIIALGISELLNVLNSNSFYKVTISWQAFLLSCIIPIIIFIIIYLYAYTSISKKVDLDVIKRGD